MAENILAKAQTTTATQTPPAVVVNAKPPVLVKLRLFGAEQTEKLSPGARLGPSSSLAGMAIILGTVEAGVFTPFEDRIRTVPTPVRTTGELKNNAFRPLSKDEIAEMKKADDKRKDKKTSAEDRQKAEAAYTEKYGKVVSVDIHSIPLPKRLDPGTTVGVCINVDAKKKFRKYPLWQIKLGNNDIVVDVFETYGQRGLNETARLVDTKNEGNEQAAKLVDYYAAELTGNVWLRSTHPFTSADVTALSETVASATMKTALNKIYQADFTSVGGDFAIDVPRGKDPSDTCSVRLRWLAGENGNCTNNVKGLDVKRDVPARIHPAAYAAVAMAAYEADLTEVHFSSSWRPMLGSMGHRSGRGLDITWLVNAESKTRLNKEGLLSKQTTDKDKDGVVDDAKKHGNITVEEQEAFNAWKKADAERIESSAAEKRAQIKLDAANKALVKATKGANADAIEKATHIQAEAQKAADAAEKTASAARDVVPTKQDAWAKLVSKHQPSDIDKFRRALMKAEVVTQVIDPWYIDLDTKDKIAGVVNKQEAVLEKSHNNHLHLTIHDPELRG